MALSKKHYEAVAKILSTSDTVAEVARRLSLYFGDGNPKFDAARFAFAAGVRHVRGIESREVVMKVFTCTDHATHWPVGGASVVVAPNKTMAEILLAGALENAGLGGREFTLEELDLSELKAIILEDGNY